MELPGRRRRGRLHGRFTDVVKEHMHRGGVTEEDAKNRVRWKQMIHCGNFKRQQ